MRRPFIAVIAVVALVAILAVLAQREPEPLRTRVDEVGPYSWGVEVQLDGTLRAILPEEDVTYLPDSRVLVPADPADRDAAEAQAEIARTWLAGGRIPGEGTQYEDMVRSALLDIHALTDDNGAALAGQNARWRYVWPRDAAFIAAALATTGHTDDAVQILRFLQSVQHPDGRFEARYLPDGSGPPDRRGIQSDGTGWVLWATDHVLQTLDDADPRRDRIRTDLDHLLRRSTTHLLALVDTPNGLPPASPDYWEHREQHLTLGTATPILAGLHSSQRIWAGRDDSLANESQVSAERLSQSIELTFSPTYARYSTGNYRDAATAFLLPPFQPEPLTGGVAAWHESIAPMQRPAGGLAPGAAWEEQSLSWTPQTSLYALAAAHNDEPEMALAWLTWIQEHRTPLGAIPEKVSPDGEPAAVAPLAWSAAVVVLAVAELEQRGQLPTGQ